MNQDSQPHTTMPLPGIPLVAEEIVKEDGRFLIYYTFPDPETLSENENSEAAHV